MDGLTQEQEDVVRASRTVRRLKVEALAGTGKTTVLVAVARDIKTRNPVQRILYTAFNRMVVDEVADKIRRFADCATVHSVAMNSVGPDFVRWKFENNPRRLRPFEAAQRLGITTPFVFEARPLSGSSPTGLVRTELKPGQQFRLARQCVERFMRSPDKEITIKHADDFIFSRRHRQSLSLSADVQRHIVNHARELWNQTIAPRTSRFEFDHGHYMKMWHLSEPVLAYDVVLFDEAQDADPLMRDVVERHAGQVIWCGDRFQSIYAWRGAVNAMEEVTADETLYLTQSFRFGQAIADVANEFLLRLGSRPIRGLPSVDSVVGDVERPTAELYRLNISALIRFVALVENGERPVINLDLVVLGMRIEALERLVLGERPDSPEFDQFEDLADLIGWLADEDVAQGEFELTMRHLIRLSGPATTLQDVDDVDVEGTVTWLGTLKKAVELARKADSTNTGRLLSTVHRVKGLQFDAVFVGDDFPALDTKSLEEASIREQWHLSYVAVTRAKQALEHHFDYVKKLPLAAIQHDYETTVRKGTEKSSDERRVSTPVTALFRTSEPNIKVVGTSYRQTELQQIARSHPDVNGRRHVAAVLEHEPANRFDSNAVAVKIDNLAVGYLPKEFASIVARKLEGGKFECDAVLLGGFSSSNGPTNWGVSLAVGWST